MNTNKRICSCACTQYCQKCHLLQLISTAQHEMVILTWLQSSLQNSRNQTQNFQILLLSIRNCIVIWEMTGVKGVFIIEDRRLESNVQLSLSWKTRERWQNSSPSLLQAKHMKREQTKKPRTKNISLITLPKFTFESLWGETLELLLQLQLVMLGISTVSTALSYGEVHTLLLLQLLL